MRDLKRCGIAAGVLLAGLTTACQPKDETAHAAAVAGQPDYLDHTLPVEERVDDLVGRMTLEEKVGQMVNGAPAIERLGVPAYNWWSEGLHGVARAGLATVFPQAIGLAATWDEDEMFKVATAISDEARAKHHAFVAKDKRFIYQGLTLWSPNINIFRDPRWGRGQETYGEDPYLTGKLAVQFIKGLQGDNPDYYKTIATVKHFAVHSGPEPERHTFNAVTDKKDLYETYLPAFEMGIKEGGAYSLMCAYNRYNGEAACGSDLLLNKILRKDWQFDGFVVSDCGAILDFHAHHKITDTPEGSAALGVKSGTDLNCGDVYLSLDDAVDQGLISEAQIDVAVKRLFTARMKLGMFDPEEKVEYAQIPYEVVDSEKHRKLAQTAAEKSIVLLKNANNTLPLKKDLGTVAVIGPNSDQWLMLLGNYNGVPANPVTPLRGIKEKVSPNTKVIFAQGSELAEGLPMLYTIPNRALRTAEGKPGLRAEFFDNAELKGKPIYTETFDTVDVNWRDQAPRKGMDDDDFGVRWTGNLVPEKSGRYQLGVISTFNTKLWLNGELVASTPYHFRDEYGDPRTKKSDWIELKAGKKYEIKVEAGETYADAQLQLVWAEPKPNLKEEALAAAKAADTVVMFMGLTARMEGEEMDIQVDGFRGGDRTKLGLPQVQQDLIKDIHALGKPTVLVLLNGSALALNWEQENIPAIVEAWYPGQAAGQAIANVLFGDVNPSGRLPVTFYKSVNDLPAFEDYDLTTQTYRFFEGEPLYPFGYGLSYTTFDYSGLQLPKRVKKGEDVSLKVAVKNTGKRTGDEVVQVYLSNKAADIKVPVRQLVNFDRVSLPPGETKTLDIKIPAEAFSYVNENGEKVYASGQFEVSVGGGQPHQKIKSTSNVQTANLILEL
jgi:beta-glucosidase